MTEQWMPGNKSELLTAIQREWDRLMETVEKLEQAGKLEMSDEGGWNPRDNLAHITEWMNILMGYHMDRRPAHEVAGVSEEMAKDWELDVINVEMFKRNKDRTSQEVLEEMKRAYRTLMDRLEAMSFDDLLKPRHDDDPQKRPLLLWVLSDSAEHFAEHRETIEKML